MTGPLSSRYPLERERARSRERERERRERDRRERDRREREREREREPNMRLVIGAVIKLEAKQLNASSISCKASKQNCFMGGMESARERAREREGL